MPNETPRETRRHQRISLPQGMSVTWYGGGQQQVSRDLLFCLFLQRTGNLWIAVGFHTAWDWGQTFYGVPDSGILPYHSVFASVFSGPLWLTGGIVGPEGSVLCPIALLVVALIFSRYYREDRYQIHKPQPTSVTVS